MNVTLIGKKTKTKDTQKSSRKSSSLMKVIYDDIGDKLQTPQVSSGGSGGRREEKTKIHLFKKKTDNFCKLGSQNKQRAANMFPKA